MKPFEKKLFVKGLEFKRVDCREAVLDSILIKLAIVLGFRIYPLR